MVIRINFLLKMIFWPSMEGSSPDRVFKVVNIKYTKLWRQNVNRMTSLEKKIGFQKFPGLTLRIWKWRGTNHVAICYSEQGVSGSAVSPPNGSRGEAPGNFGYFDLYHV